MNARRALRRALEDARETLPDDDPLWERLEAAYANARNHGIDGRVAARWAVVRITQVVPLHERAVKRMVDESIINAVKRA